MGRQLGVLAKKLALRDRSCVSNHCLTLGRFLPLSGSPDPPWVNEEGGPVTFPALKQVGKDGCNSETALAEGMA